MGVFDTIIGTCPHCGGEFSSQTKLFSNTLSFLEIGANLGAYDSFERLELKDSCTHCSKPVVMVVREGMFEALEKDNPEAREDQWGAIHPARKDNG